MPDEQSISWVMHADIQGFKKLHQDNYIKAYEAVDDLLCDVDEIIYSVPSSDDAMPQCHHLGDGVIISPVTRYDPDFTMERPIAMAIALHRLSLSRGILLKIAFGEGDVGDVKSCYRKFNERMERQVQLTKLGGILTVSPILGDGYIDAHKIACYGHGPVLIMRKGLYYQWAMPETKSIISHDYVSIDWLHSTFKVAEELLVKLGHSSNTEILEEKLIQYIENNGNLTEIWQKSALHLLRGYE